MDFVEVKNTISSVIRGDLLPKFLTIADDIGMTATAIYDTQHDTLTPKQLAEIRDITAELRAIDGRLTQVLYNQDV